MPIENPKTLDQLIDLFNENPAVFGWKSKCEELIIFAERLEQWLAERDELIEQMRGALKNECLNHCEERFSRDCPPNDCRDCKTKAALEAAERAGK